MWLPHGWRNNYCEIKFPEIERKRVPEGLLTDEDPYQWDQRTIALQNPLFNSKFNKITLFCMFFFLWIPFSMAMPNAENYARIRLFRRNVAQLMDSILIVILCIMKFTNSQFLNGKSGIQQFSKQKWINGFDVSSICGFFIFRIFFYAMFTTYQ